MAVGPFLAWTGGGGGTDLDKIYIWLEIMAGLGLGLVILLLFTASHSFNQWKYRGFFSAIVAQLIVFISLRFPA